MKKLTLILTLMLIGIMPMKAERVTPETAKKVATTFLNNNGAKSAQLTDLSKAAGFPNLYVFTSEQGFVVMSADDCVMPILGYSLTGGLIDGDMPSNMRSWLQGYNDEIQSAIDNQMKSSTETSKKWKDLIEGKPNAAKTSVVVAPLIQTKWNQNRYYNDLCPAVSDGINGHAYTGCVATAMAQIMKYWGYPSHGIGSHSYTWNNQTLSADFGSTTYDWNNMNPYYEYYTDDNGSTHWLPAPTSAELTAIATLMYHCGVSVSMIYGGNSTGGSSATNAAVASALKTYFNYSPAIEHKQKSYNSQVFYSNEVWASMVKAELNANRPLQYGGQDPNSNSGHAFVCDGYNSDNYFHFNWGWAGQLNGYFSLNNLDTGANSGQSGAGNGVYTRDQEAVFGIQPVQSAASEPTNLTYTLNGLQNITLNWTAVSGAASYNVYRNGNFVGNSNINSYTEIAPFGTNVYYVRSVDANGNLSLSSNYATVTVGYLTPIVSDLQGTKDGNNISLSWTAPNWCYPQTPSATLTYGDGNLNSMNSCQYWAHRYLANNLSQYANKAVYKISFYAYEAGSYTCSVYKGTTNQTIQGESVFFPTTLLASKSIEVTSTFTWIDIDLDEPIIIDNQNDIWVVMYDPINGTNDRYSATLSTNTGSNNHGGYWGRWTMGDGRKGYVLNQNYAFLIRTFLTDGTYTYNLYQDGIRIANNLSETSYDGTLNNNSTNLFTVKTNYYGGETNASNMAGITIGTASLSSLTMGANDKMTLTEGSQLTVSGPISNESPENLVLENGAQLMHSSEGVQATIKRDIAAYTAESDGWYTIAIPFSTYDPTNELTIGTYDLYSYDEDGNNEGKEWINYEAGAFDLTTGAGYLYANSEARTLSMTGILNSGDYSQTVELSYANSNYDMKGFNLLGNPTAHEISFTKTANVSDGYYYLNNGSEWTYTTETTVPAGRGFLVKANAEGQSVTLNPQNRTESSENGQYVSVSIGSKTIYVKLNDGVSMPLFDLKGQHNRLYFTNNHKPYAMLVLNGAKEAGLCFEPSHNGMQTLTVDTQDLNLNYLHLIDNMTGDDVDLLITPNYTFEAKTSDYASRFRLVFSQNDPNGSSTGSETFAYVCDGNIIVSHEGNATLQIMDAAGRMVASIDDVSESVSTSNMPAGVYVLRLITDETVKTQKIVIE